MDKKAPLSTHDEKGTKVVSGVPISAKYGTEAPILDPIGAGAPLDPPMIVGKY